MHHPRTSRRLLSALAAVVFAAGCAQSVGDVNRVQPNVVRKSDLLDGQWYFRNTVTHTPHNTNFTFPGQTGNMEKLVWEIQQGMLVGYRSYQYTPGAESNVDATSKVSGTTATYCDAAGKCVGGKKYYGAPVVAFPITAHFDIQREYNPATGETSNVVSENMSDRPWNQREYVRVNWSMNELNKGSGLNWGTVQNPSGGSSGSNWIQPNETGEDSYDWPTFEYDDKGKLKYFDVTGRYMANPDTYYFEGFGDVPLCLLTYGVDCSASEITMRISISKVDEKFSRDYEPLLYGNDLMSMFGYFRTERLNYDRRFGVLESARILLANRYRIWDSYYQKDAAGEPNYAQPLPLAQRTPKPIVYYFTRADRMGGPERYQEFMEPAKSILEPSYDKAFRRAVAAAQGNDKDWTQIRRMFFLCNNPVKDGDPAECGAPGFSPKFGDLRYSFVNTIAEPVANGLLGYGPSSADPETGMLVSGNSNTYTWGVDLIGRQLVDHIMLLNGDKTIPNYISGDDMRTFIASNPIYNVAKAKEESVSAALQGVPQSQTETVGAWDRPTERMQGLMSGLLAQRAFSQRATGITQRNELQAAADHLAKFPDLEAQILDNPEVQSDLVNLLPTGVRERAENDANFRRQASRAVLTDFTKNQAFQRFRLSELSKHCVMMAEFYDRTMVGLANDKVNFVNEELRKAGAPEKCTKRIVDLPEYVVNDAGVIVITDAGVQLPAADRAECMRWKQPIYDRIARDFRQQMWLATTLHEAGHTFNLRHNFSGSYDAVNYFDEYWQLKKNSITVLQNNERKLPRTPADLKAAAEGTEGQRLNSMHNYEYSSIMDYHGKRNGDWAGLGKYDEAAIIFAYSGDMNPGYVEVFRSARGTTERFNGSDGTQMSITGAAVDLPMVNATATTPLIYNYTERYHYSTVPLHFGEGTDITSVINNGVEKLKGANRRLAKWTEVKAQEEQIRAALIADPTLVDDATRLASVTQGKLMRVPYMFCSDESADGPVLSCYRFDRGPDYYEKVRTELEDFWNYYYDTHYRRDRAWFSGNTAINNAFSTFYTVANVYKHWVFRQYKQAERTQEISNNFKVDPLIQDYWTMAVLDGVNNQLNVMAVPEYGLFYLRNLTTGPQWDVLSQGEDFDELTQQGRARLEDFYTQNRGARDFLMVPRGMGRRMYSRYDFKSGFGFFNRMSEAGHYNDQIGAMFAAVLPNIDIQGTDQDADWNRYNIPYYTVFRPEFQANFGSLWSDDEDKVRPQLYRAVDNTGAVTARAVMAQRRFIAGGSLFSGFDYPKAPPTACPGSPECVRTAQSLAPVNISITWTSRIYSLWLGMALFRVNYDLDYAKSNQIFKLGSAEDFNVGPGYHSLEMPDIVNGARYVAIERDGAAPDSTPAVRMLTIGQSYLTMVRNPATCPLPRYLEQEGYRCMRDVDATNAALVETRRKFWTELYQDAVRDLDLMRNFYMAFGSAF